MGRVVTLTDISNLQAENREHSDKNNLETLVAHLSAIDGKIFTGENNTFPGLLL